VGGIGSGRPFAHGTSKPIVENQISLKMKDLKNKIAPESYSSHNSPLYAILSK